jgi:[calcium/calmodulin-dependent protein kinase] kinase
MLLPTEENTTDIIPSPTEEDVASAITKSIRNVMAVVSQYIFSLPGIVD